MPKRQPVPKGADGRGQRGENRVASPVYPNTVKGVVAQKNQFTTYRGGALANRTPNASSVIAAKLVMDGGVVEEVRNARYFDSSAGSWASRHKRRRHRRAQILSMSSCRAATPSGVAAALFSFWRNWGFLFCIFMYIIESPVKSPF